MKYELFDYQEAAKATILKALTRMTQDYAEDPEERGAVALSAPTGAGKTVIATAVIESALDGDDEVAGIGEATFLWVTDDPSLNRQTLNKMVAASSSLAPNRLIPIENDFDQKVLDPGRVYFLNIQKLAVTAGLAKSGDGREYSLWQTIANTVLERPNGFIVVVDEAHRGMKSTKASNENRDTIVSRIIGDPSKGQPEVPIVWGISAVPRRFRDEMGRRGRTMKSHVIPIAEVRDSGLLKDQIVLGHTQGVDAAESTLVRHGVAKLREYEASWSAYCEMNNEPPVDPIIVVQVEDKASTSDLGDLVNTVFDEWGDISAANVVHTFASHALEKAGAHSIAYCPPEDIQDRSDVRVVLCKTAITTGWDCPRAEVLVSMRVARDADLITQVMGRMVRSPLARRIETDETLNSVHCVLPKFDGDAVNAIAQRFEKGDEDNMASGTKVVLKPTPVKLNPIFIKPKPVKPTPEPGEGPSEEKQSDEDTSWFGGEPETPKPTQPPKPKPQPKPESGQLDILDPPPTHEVSPKGEQDVFAVITGLPSYTIPTKSFRTPVTRLFSLATLLAAKYDGASIEATAMSQARNALLAEIQTRRSNLEDAGTFAGMLGEAATTSLYERVVTYAGETVDPKNSVTALDIDNRGLAILMERARRAFPEGLANLYVTKIAPDDSDVTDAMLIVVALSRDEELPGLIQQRASDLVAQWLGKYASDISRLSAADRDRFDRIRRESDRPLLTNFSLPEARTDNAEGKPWERHVLAGEDGMFRINLPAWEEHVLTEELDHGAIAWYRNPSTGMHSLRVPYISANGIRGMSPDFIFVHKLGDNLVASLIDPHGTYLTDAVPKLKGLSAYAAQHGESFHRIQSIAKLEKEFRMLNLQDPAVRKGIDDFGGVEAAELFKTFGSKY